MTEFINDQNNDFPNQKMSRRSFVNYSGSCMALGVAGLTSATPSLVNAASPKSRIRIRKVDSNFEREPLFPYRFKGGVLKENWQTAAYLEADSGIAKVGLGTQGVLWSDAKVHDSHSVNGGNALMYAMSEYAVQLLKGHSFTDPIQLLDEILPQVLAYGRKITDNEQLRKTFALNSLVCVDNAAWLLYAAENKMASFDDMIPAPYRPGLSYRHNKVASMPSFSVGADISKIVSAADQGYFMMKLKLGSAGTQKEMLQKDMDFLSGVHKALGHYETPYTKSGKIPYYFDANERYDEKDTLSRLLDHARKIGAFDQIALIEEPFGERNSSFVGDMGITIAADESAHDVEDVATRIEQGYSAIALKAIAKTLSMTIKITQLAFEKKVPCFCADLTVNPILVDWNKNVAARLTPFPNIKIGIQEANGRQYYKNWDKLVSYYPKGKASWAVADKGVFHTDASFYKESGGIFDVSEHYAGLFKDDEN